MDLFQVTLITSATVMLLISGFFVITKTMPSRPGINWWLCASLLQIVILIFELINNGHTTDKFSAYTFICLGMAVIQFTCIGTYVFADIEINIKNRLLILFAAINFSIFLIVTGQDLFARVTLAAYVAYYLTTTAHKIYKKNNKLNFKFTSVLMVLLAIHYIDYPVLSNNEELIAIGYIIWMFLLTGIFASLSTLALTQFKITTLDSERRAIEASIRDHLTKVYNRSHLDTLFKNYAKEAQQLDRSFVLLYFDLDGFKKVNDNYGHDAGDQILKTTTKRMSDWLGVKGDVIRIGGDELLILAKLRDTEDEKNASVAAQLLLDIVEQPISYNNNTHHISASVGGVCYGHPNFELNVMLNKADQLMYKAKQAGGKRVYFSNPVRVSGKKLDKNKDTDTDESVMLVDDNLVYSNYASSNK